MKYTPQEVMQYIEEENVKFIRLAFCDIHGCQKNISIMPHELERAFKYGIAIDGSAIAGFGDEVHSDLFLHPDPATITVLPGDRSMGGWYGCFAPLPIWMGVSSSMTAGQS